MVDQPCAPTIERPGSTVVLPATDNFLDDKISAARAKAEASFRRADGSEEGPLQTAQKSEERAIAEKTARLRALRLAKEEALRANNSKPRHK